MLAIFRICGKGSAKNFFTIFVDRFFTILDETAFTNRFDLATRNAAVSCLCPPCIIPD
jgi:hypothetical protein